MQRTVRREAPGAGATAGETEEVKAADAQDTRVHCCLYLLAPTASTGNALKTLDLIAMKKLHEKVNLVPVIAKSDTFTKKEVAAFKKRVRRALL